MKKYIRFFIDKDHGIPISAYQLLPKEAQTNNSIVDDAETVYEVITQWMVAYPMGKVDIVMLTT